MGEGAAGRNRTGPGPLHRIFVLERTLRWQSASADAARRINAGMRPFGVSNERFRRAARALQSGERFPPLILAGPHYDDLVCLEGNLRLTAHALAGFPIEADAWSARHRHSSAGPSEYGGGNSLTLSVDARRTAAAAIHEPGNSLCPSVHAQVSDRRFRFMELRKQGSEPNHRSPRGASPCQHESAQPATKQEPAETLPDSGESWPSQGLRRQRPQRRLSGESDRASRAERRDPPVAEAAAPDQRWWDEVQSSRDRGQSGRPTASSRGVEEFVSAIGRDRFRAALAA